MANPGIAPADLSSPVGKFRLNTNDLTYIELDPPVVGQGDYTHSSDAEIEAFIAQGGDNVSRALGYYYQYLASQAALSAHNIKDTDLAVNTEKRAELLSKVAQDWFDRADTEDDASGTGDIFESYRFGGEEDDAYAEAAAYPISVY